MGTDPPQHAWLGLPSWLWGGNPSKMLASMDCRYRTRSDGAGGYAVQTEEAYLRRPPDLVRCRTLFGPGIKPRLQDLANLEERIDFSMPPEVEPGLAKLNARVEKTHELIDLVNYSRIALCAIPTADLPDHVAGLMNTIRGTPLAEDLSVHPFDGAGVHVVEADSVLLNRLKIASIMLRLDQDPRLGSGDLSSLQHAATDGVFLSSEGLYNGVYLLEAYLAPLLGALAPGVWGFTVQRNTGPLIISLGRSVAGTRGEATEMLQLVTVSGPTDRVAAVELAAGAAADAIDWWVARLNLLFGALSDLAVFTDPAGRYRADKHLQAMLTIEQIFLRTTSMQVAHRDANARRTLMFSVLDSIERLNGWDLLKMFNMSHAQGVLGRLEDSLPAGAGEVLLPMARRATESLRGVQEDFFITRQLGTDLVELRMTDGSSEKMAREDAAAHYLKLLRDATHGHGGKGRGKDRVSALLAHHNGRVPHDIGLLAYLYLLDLMANPDRLRRCLYRSGK